MDRIDNLQAFVRVVETGSFAEAARQLGVTTSAISKRVNQIEAMLEAQLLRRTTRKLTPTDLGSTYYERAAEILTLFEDAEQSIRKGQVTPVGRLRVSSPTSFGVLHLAPAICQFHDRFPSLRIEVILNDRAVNPVEEGFDVSLQDLGKRPGSMVERKLFPIRRVVCASPAYLQRRGVPRHPNELVRHDCVHYSYLESGDEWRFESASGPVSVKIEPYLSTNNGGIMHDAVLSGKGIAVLPTFLVFNDLSQGALVPILREFTFPTMSLSAIYPQRKHLALKVKVFLDYLVERFGPEPVWNQTPAEA
jgi:DNA-binding transcriptional LysR family regulator